MLPLTLTRHRPSPHATLADTSKRLTGKKEKAEAAARRLTEALIAAVQHGTPQAGCRGARGRGRARLRAPGSASGAAAGTRRAPLPRITGSGGLEGRGAVTAVRRPERTGLPLREAVGSGRGRRAPAL